MIERSQKLGAAKNTLADFYITSGSVKFGQFKLAVHEAQPDLEPTPIYMHFPKTGELGYEILPKIYELVGELFADIINEKSLRFTKICAIPSGADPLASSTIKSLGLGEEPFLSFKKKIDTQGNRQFSGPVIGELNNDDVVLVLDDHTSGGYTKSLFIDYLNSRGAIVTDILTVVNRQQGATKFLSSKNVVLHEIFTISELLNYYVETNQINRQTADAVQKYINENQIIIT